MNSQSEFASMAIAVISVVPAFLALLMSAVRRSFPRVPQAWIIATFVGALFVWLLTFIPDIRETGAIALSIPWVPQLGLTLSLYLDGLSLTFALIIIGIGAIIVLYAGYYFEDAAEL